jgi:hypothetical protein
MSDVQTKETSVLKKSLTTAAVVAFATGALFAGSPAHADITTSGNGSVLSGNQAVVDVNLPVNVCGNAIALLGVAGANCVKSGAAVH